MHGCAMVQLHKEEGAGINAAPSAPAPSLEAGDDNDGDNDCNNESQQWFEKFCFPNKESFVWWFPFPIASRNKNIGPLQ